MKRRFNYLHNKKKKYKKKKMNGKKVIIFYYSYSSMSTEKLLKGIKESFPDIELLLLPSEEKNDVSSYDYIGFASGIYAWNFGKPVYEKIEKLIGLEGKNCFSLCTSGSASEKYPGYIKDAIEKKKGKFIGGWGCQGGSNYFPLSLFGGLHMNKPDKNDIQNGTQFLQKIIQ